MNISPSPKFNAGPHQKAQPQPQSHETSSPYGYPAPSQQPFDASTVIYNPLPLPPRVQTQSSTENPDQYSSEQQASAQPQPQPQPQGFPEPPNTMPEPSRYTSPSRQTSLPQFQPQTQSQPQSHRPTSRYTNTHTNPNRTTTLKAAKTSAAESLRDLLILQQQQARYHHDHYARNATVLGGTSQSQTRARERDAQLRLVVGSALDDIKILRDQVLHIAREAESHRWRRLLLGGIMATLIPLLRAIWRKPPADQNQDHSSSSVAATDTEYAFHKSRSLMRRILDLNLGHGLRKLASLTFVVFAAVYVFQNEVKLRVARTMAKKLKRLGVLVGRSSGSGNDNGVRVAFMEEDVKVLENWRWRILG